MTLMDTHTAATAVTFTAVTLSKGEVFSACQALADAESTLRRVGHAGDADALFELFELLERRLCA
jgi:hypothetical protein